MTGRRSRLPVEQVAVERSVLSPGTIEHTLRNTGPDPVRVAQIFVNDVYISFTGATQSLGRLATDTVRMDFPWQDGQPYRVSLLTSTGAVIEQEIPVAVQIAPGLRTQKGRMLNPATIGGLSAGLAIMYATGLFVAA